MKRLQHKNLCGQRVMETRTMRELTQDQLAAQVTVAGGELGFRDWYVSRDMIQAVERRNKRVTDELLFVLSVVLDADPRWLIGHPKGIPPEKPQRSK